MRIMIVRREDALKWQQLRIYQDIRLIVP